MCHSSSTSGISGESSTSRNDTPPATGSSAQPPSMSPPWSTARSGPPVSHRSVRVEKALPTAVTAPPSSGTSPVTTRRTGESPDGGRADAVGQQAIDPVGDRPQHGDHVGPAPVVGGAPAVAGAALDHVLAGGDGALAVIEAEHDRALEHHHQVEGVGGVHAGHLRVVAVDPQPGLVGLGAGRDAGHADHPHADASGGWLEGEARGGAIGVVGESGARSRRSRTPRSPRRGRHRRCWGPEPSWVKTSAPLASNPVTTRLTENSDMAGAYGSGPSDVRDRLRCAGTRSRLGTGSGQFGPGAGGDDPVPLDLSPGDRPGREEKRT